MVLDLEDQTESKPTIQGIHSLRPSEKKSITLPLTLESDDKKIQCLHKGPRSTSEIPGRQNKRKIGDVLRWRFGVVGHKS